MYTGRGTLVHLLLSALQAFDEKTPVIRDIHPMQRAIIFGIQDDSLALLPMVTRATFRHAWQKLYRNLTLVDIKGTPFSLDRVVYETMAALADAARRLAKAHVIEYCRWDHEDEDTRPKLHRAAKPFLTVDFVSARPGVKIELKPDFATALRIARDRAYPTTT